MPHSLGMFYGTYTELLGYREDNDEWKVMAMSAFDVDYEKYLDSKESRNESTDYKSKSQHYDDIEAMLMWQGSDLRRK